MVGLTLRVWTEKLFGVPALAGKPDQRTLKRGHQTVKFDRHRISKRALTAHQPLITIPAQRYSCAFPSASAFKRCRSAALAKG